MTHSCKGYFPLWKRDWRLQRGWFYGIFPWIRHFRHHFLESFTKMWILLNNSIKLTFFATVSHGCKGKNILRKHESWLQRIFSPSQPWLTVAKRLISWDLSMNMAFWTPFLTSFHYKMWILVKNSIKLTFLQPSVMVAKGKIFLAIMTHGCKAVKVDKFWSLLKIWINEWIW